ncbi:helix-turn-helix domain-containing protein [Halomonas sp. EGI 63088]|uniref:Helix-turn-helix domain-containing protein n=1 Tax=Halomonas flagellata TaxID=2920385 RepID=A0ABS9RXM9_9GAMM|nr:helix-turn-helix domain-containing protein [Halomonas flagellata]MCH4564580.1 helix-turn-helix domain-containing protein [Halomonas flagellata]
MESELAWRQQACLLAALPRLSAGASITAIALELGYDSPSAFSTMFRKALGQPPSAFVGSSHGYRPRRPSSPRT